MPISAGNVSWSEADAPPFSKPTLLVFLQRFQACSWARGCAWQKQNRFLKQLGWEPTIKLADGLKITYTWIREQLTNEQDHSAFSKSTIVQTTAPRELGSLREADGSESFGKAKQAVREGFETAGVTRHGHAQAAAA